MRPVKASFSRGHHVIRLFRLVVAALGDSPHRGLQGRPPGTVVRTLSL
ncbi:MAG TPA: hypothetical protein VFD15_03350 [Clostridia bacterium]|nr:hypothetical protein [Clostridia bacterium]